MKPQKEMCCLDRQAVIGLYARITTDIIKTLVAIDIDQKEINEKAELGIVGEIIAVIPLSGDTSGSLSVSFSKDFAAELSSKIAFCDITELTEQEILEGVGEILNQISGSFRTALWEKGCKVEIGIPQIHTSPDNKFILDNKLPIYEIIFEYKNHSFALQICMPFKN